MVVDSVLLIISNLKDLYQEVERLTSAIPKRERNLLINLVTVREA